MTEDHTPTRSLVYIPARVGMSRLALDTRALRLCEAGVVPSDIHDPALADALVRIDYELQELYRNYEIQDMTEEQPVPAPSRPSRSGRRRSRQCRGKRARNYVRALDREQDDNLRAVIVSEARATGAVAELQRQQRQAIEEEAAGQ